MQQPTNYFDFADTRKNKGYSDDELREIALAHCHADRDTFESCGFCSEMFENGEWLLPDMLLYWKDTISTKSIETLWNGMDGYCDVFSTRSFEFKLDLGLCQNAALEHFSKVPYNLVGIFGNENIQDHEEYQPYFKLFSAHPRCTPDLITEFQNEMHGQLWECGCSDPSTCPMCVGQHE